MPFIHLYVCLLLGALVLSFACSSPAGGMLFGVCGLLLLLFLFIPLLLLLPSAGLVVQPRHYKVCICLLKVILLIHHPCE